MAGTHDSRDVTAALNNAQWCAAVWRSHGLPIEQAHGMWFTTSPAPLFYPNFVTVDPAEDPVLQAHFIAALAAERSDIAVKDSFACLPLDGLGFRRLFEARWLQHDRVEHADARADALHWMRVTNGDDLESWERAWRAGEAAHAGVFRQELLADSQALVMARLDRSGGIKGGGIGYEAAGALGVTNIFGDAEGLLSALRSHASTRLIVCYEHGRELRTAQQKGFEPLGPLIVWTRGA